MANSEQDESGSAVNAFFRRLDVIMKSITDKGKIEAADLESYNIRIT